MNALKILSYNIHKGFSATNLKFTLNEMKRAIQSVNIDLVFLQEIRGYHDKHIKEILTTSQIDFLADQKWPYMAYGRNAVYPTGDHGNAILSKYPILLSKNIDISSNKLERRGMLHTQIDIPGQPTPIHAICLHLNLLEKGRELQISRLCDYISEKIPADQPIVIGGDFNDWRQRASAILNERLQLKEVFMTLHDKHARTFPSAYPLFCLDRIYVRGLEISSSTTYTKKPWNRLSDHAAIFCKLRLLK